MNVVLISASPRKERSRTFLLAKEVVRGLSGENVAVETIHLCDCKIDFCRHCEACHKKVMNCPIKDDVGSIIEEMLKADAIILATPNYINQVTAGMKALFDRASHFIHCKRLLGKYVAGVVTSGSGCDAPVLDYLMYYSHVCGAQYAGGVSSRAPVSEEKMEEAFAFGGELARNVREKKIYPRQMKIIEEGKEHFRQIMEIRKKDWSGEYRYWVEKGWMG